MSSDCFTVPSSWQIEVPLKFIVISTPGSFTGFPSLSTNCTLSITDNSFPSSTQALYLSFILLSLSSGLSGFSSSGGCGVLAGCLGPCISSPPCSPGSFCSFSSSCSWLSCFSSFFCSSCVLSSFSGCLPGCESDSSLFKESLLLS